MIPEHIAVLVNPVAGGGRALAAGRDAVRRFREKGLTVEELVARDSAEGASWAKRAVSDGIDALVVCGGDGIVHQAIGAVASTTTALGVIPGGTGNDFARSIGIPRDSVERAVEIVLAGKVAEIDLGRAGGTWFGGVLASGFDSKVNDRANNMSWPRGRMRYNLAMVAELASFRPIGFELGLDRRSLEMEAMLVAVGNGPSYGGGMRICPDASLTDGLLEVTVISRMSRATLMRIFPSVHSGRHVRRPEVLTFRASEVTLAAPDVTAYADGELVAALPLTCIAVGAALKVFVPDRSSGVAPGERQA